MRLPFLQPIPSSRQIVEEFRGYNHNLRIGDGEFFDMKNMTSDYYPILSPRGQRGVHQEYEENSRYTGMIAKDALCYVKDGKFYINKSPVNDLELDHNEKQLVSMGAYVIILPDKKWVNTEDRSFGDIEATYTVGEARYAMCKLDGTVYDYTKITADNSPPENPDNLTLWIDTSATPHSLKQYSADTAVWTAIATTYVRISATGIGSNFKQYDAVKISGLPDELKDMDNTTCVLWDVKQDFIVIVGLLEKAIENHKEILTIERTMPEMDFVIEANNRLWGCSYGLTEDKTKVVNEIYCSKLGDFKNWECYMGISTDSWAASVGTDGQWTGAITHLGYPLFFKENYLHKVYGNYPANFQIQTTECSGVQKGSSKSLAIVNTTLFYKGRSGVCAYDGSLPIEISYPLGNELYSKAVGGAIGNKYYVSMNDAYEKRHLFVFDVAKSMWHREDDIPVEEFCSCRGELYAIANGEIITMLGSGTPDPSPVEWMVETGDIGLSSPDSKYISRINLRMQMDLSSEIYISIRYDFNEVWEQVAYLKGDRLQSFTIPIIPKRCDSLRLRIEGMGDVKIYSITKTIEGGSDIV